MSTQSPSLVLESSVPRAVSGRRDDLDRAKGLAILLVVLGHLVPASAVPPMHNEWYLYLRQVLYEFHMPFFMYLSGYVTFLSGAATTSLSRWPTLVGKRATRLLLPFVVFGVAIAVGKFAAGYLFPVDNMPASPQQALLGLVWNTDASPATSVWYVAVLFVYCILTPPLLWLFRGRIEPLLVLALVCYFVPVPHVLYLNRIATYFVFFLLGGAGFRMGHAWLDLIDRYVVFWLLAFVSVSVAFTFERFQIVDWEMRFIIAGSLSMPALHGAVRRTVLKSSPLLIGVGAFSFIIYLLNTPFIGLAKGVLGKFLGAWDGNRFPIYAVLLMMSGTLGPILIKRYVLKPFPSLDKMTS